MPKRHTPDSFWGKVFILGEHDCWEYIGPRTVDGYGQIGYQGKQTTAHRISWLLSVGEIGQGLSVLHECDNPSCCNPSHLFLGTQVENMADMAQKGRWRKGKKPDGFRAATGERQHSAKLNWVKVRDIRQRASGGAKYLHLAREFGVDPSTVADVVKMHTWWPEEQSNRT